MATHCPFCGAHITPNSDGSCPSCGAILVQSSVPIGGQPNPYAEPGQRRVVVQRRGPDPRVVEFHQKLFAATPRTYVTPIIVALNIIVFVAMVINGDNGISPRAANVLPWGANHGSDTLAGEWWRLFTCTFIHIGILHIGFNMWILWDIGQLIERLVGNLGYLILYVVCGLVGSLASVFTNPYIVSAGASGAVFGMFGALLGFLALQRHSVPMGIVRQLRHSVIIFIGLNLVLGFTVSFIDNAAHIGGLVAGFFGGLIVSHSLDGNVVLTRLLRNAALLFIGTTVIAIAILFAPSPPLDIGREEERILNVYEEAYKKWQSKEIENEQLADIVQQDVLIPWQRLQRELERHPLKKKNPEEFEQFQSYMRLRQESWQTLVEMIRTKDRGKVRRLKKNGKSQMNP